MAEQLQIFAEGELLEGWKSVRVSQGIDRLAGSFEMGLAELSPEDPRARKLLRGQRIEIRIDGDLVLGGVIKRRTKAYNGQSHSITIAGQDILADLVDCSATNEPGTWKAARVETIVRQLLEPFPDLRFRADLSSTSLGTEEKFAVSTGESPFSCIDRLARMRGFLVVSDLEGGVYFTRPGETVAPIALERGSNLEEGEISEDDSNRFSRYIVHQGGPTLQYWDAGAPGQNFRAEALDPGVTRSRPLVMIGEEAAGEGKLQQRAQFEANVRAARSVRVSYTLPGWTIDGYLPRPGVRVPVFDPLLGVGTSTGAPLLMVIGALERQGPGLRTRLELYPPGAFTTEDVASAPEPELPLWDLE